MRAELDALKSKLETLTRPAFLGVAPDGEPAPYYLVELASGVRPDDLPLLGSSAWDLRVRVKSVGRTFEQALEYLTDARDVLSPNALPGSLTVAGRGVNVSFVRHEADYVDRDVTPPKHISLDTFTVSSVPA